MVELSLMPSALFSPTGFHQEPGLPRLPKDLQALATIHIQGKRQDVPRSAFLQHSVQDTKNVVHQLHLLPDSTMSLINKKPVPIDVQDSCSDSVLFTFGIAEQCSRQEKILNFLMSGSTMSEAGGLNISLLSDLMGFRTMAINTYHPLYVPNDDFCLYEIGMDEHQHSLHQQMQLFAPDPFVDFVGNMTRSSVLTIDQNGQVLFTGSGAEMKDLLSILSEFHLSKGSRSGNKLSMLVPYFTRRGGGRSRANGQVSSLQLQTQTAAPLTSPENLKLKTSTKKKRNKRSERERDLYQKNYFRACESFLTLILDKNRGGSMSAIVSLKKSGPEISQFLNQISAGLAGTGLAVLSSVLCKVAFGPVSFSATKLLNTGFGLGLFWLSWAVIRLSHTISFVSKNSGHKKLSEEEIAGKIGRSMNDILFRAATVLAVVVMRFA
ncbi:uncharacterized protein [Typha latifolia]|uniref:uncharacterized protein n=1 Tax=Typha latifolia TaxID=4733 RepID=UPI003C2D4391